jgi:hypothetical protein
MNDDDERELSSSYNGSELDDQIGAELAYPRVGED